MVYTNVIALLEISGFPFRGHAHAPVTTIAQAHRTVPHLARNLMKSVVLRIKDAGWILAAAPFPSAKTSAWCSTRR